MTGLRESRLTADPYRKWSGIQWRLALMVKLGVNGVDPVALNIGLQTLEWLHSPSRKNAHPVKEERARIHASVYVNGLGVWSKLGLAPDERVEHIANHPLRTQWRMVDGIAFRSSGNAFIVSRESCDAVGVFTTSEGNLGSRCCVIGGKCLRAPPIPQNIPLPQECRDNRQRMVELALSCLLAFQLPGIHVGVGQVRQG